MNPRLTPTTRHTTHNTLSQHTTKITIIALIFLVTLTGTGFAITFVQSNSSDETTTVTLNGVTAGNLIVLWVKWEGTTTGGATVSDGTSSLEMGTLSDPGDYMVGQFAYLLSANGGNKTYTVTFPSGATYPRLRIAEFSYSGSISLDQQNIGSGYDAAPQSGNITTTGTDEVVLGGYAEYTGNDFLNQQINDIAADGISTGTYAKMWYKIFSSTFSNGHAQGVLSPAGGDWVCNIISFKATAANVYYSVGQNTSDHKTGTPTMNISSGTATFSTGQTATNLGVGDRVTYNTSSIAYISGKTSTTVWSLVTATGGTLADTTGATVNSIAHEYISLQAAEAGASDASHINNTSLVAANVILNIPCYYDSGADTTAVTIDGWTTDATRYIKIYTPNNTSTECNQSQRHSGTAGTGYVIGNTGTSHVFTISDDYVRIEGVAVDVSNLSSSAEGFRVNNTGFRLSHFLIYGDKQNSNTDTDGIYFGTNGITAYIWNGFIWDLERAGIQIQGYQNVTVYIHNVTVWNVIAADGESMYPGIGYDDFGRNNSGSTIYCRNCSVYTWKGNYDYLQDGAAGQVGVVSVKNSAAADTSISNPQQGITDDGGNIESVVQANQFVSLSGTIDLHLKAGADLIGAGANLYNDANLAFQDDIDEDDRGGSGAPWDIGADECTTCAVSQIFIVD